MEVVKINAKDILNQIVDEEISPITFREQAILDLFGDKARFECGEIIIRL